MADAIVLISNRAHQQAWERAGRKSGTPLPIDRVATRSTALKAALADGGDLYVVHMGVGGLTTLVARLVAPRYEDGAWVAEPNRLVRSYVTELLGKLSLASGEGLPAELGELKKVLRGGRALTPADVRLLTGPPVPHTEIELELTNPRHPKTPSALRPWEKHQLRIAGRLYDGQDLSIAQRLRPDDAEPSHWLRGLSVYDLVDAQGRVSFDAWFYCTDTGTIFRHRTREVVAEVVQFALETEDQGLADAIRAAAERARAKDMVGITLSL